MFTDLEIRTMKFPGKNRAELKFCGVGRRCLYRKLF
jgi:hypothetical protein